MINTMHTSTQTLCILKPCKLSTAHGFMAQAKHKTNEWILKGHPQLRASTLTTEKDLDLSSTQFFINWGFVICKYYGSFKTAHLDSCCNPTMCVCVCINYNISNYLEFTYFLQPSFFFYVNYFPTRWDHTSWNLSSNIINFTRCASTSQHLGGRAKGISVTSRPARDL